MERIDCLIFGYRKLKVAPEDLHEITSIFLRSSIFSKINSDGTITIRERDFSKIRKLLDGRIEFGFSEPLGIHGKWLMMKNKALLLVTLFVSLLCVILLSSLVWDIRIEGNENISDRELIMELSEAGIEVGDFWKSVDKSSVEATLVNIDDRIAWVNINRRGVVAYLTVIEKEKNSIFEVEESTGYCNVVATVDCLIHEITVSRGVAMVKPGDVVKRGDILIAGVLPEESGGGFCKAEGRIVGQVSETIDVMVERKYEKSTEYDVKRYSCDINFFKNSINIFKLYGNLTNECDIIEKEITFSLLGKSKLPFSVSIKYIPQYTCQISEYTDDEIVSVASSRLNSILALKLAGSDLVRIKSYGNFTNDGYMMSSEIVYHTEVGEKSFFESR